MLHSRVPDTSFQGAPTHHSRVPDTSFQGVRHIIQIVAVNSKVKNVPELASFNLLVIIVATIDLILGNICL